MDVDESAVENPGSSGYFPKGMAIFAYPKPAA